MRCGLRGMAITISMAAAAASATADPVDVRGSSYFGAVDNVVEQIVTSQDFLDLINASSKMSGGLTEDEIIALDNQWRSGDDDLIDPILKNALSQRLAQIIEDENGRFSEIIVMDRKGLNVAVSSRTSDYWQGDEAKFLETYAAGRDREHVAKVDFDESTQLFAQQFSKTLMLRGGRIGAITLGVNIAYHD